MPPKEIGLRYQILILAGIGSLYAILAHAFYWFSQAISVAEHGTTAFLFFAPLFLFPVIIACPLLLPAGAGLCFRRTRKGAVLLLALVGSSSLVFLSFVGMSRSLGWKDPRHRGFFDLARRSVPLVAAIRAYEAKRGEPPPNLAALVPEFLPSVPSTGMGAYPKYEYASDSSVAQRYEGNPWVLFVNTGSGALNFDRFIYLPRQNYPERGYGGWLEKIEDWAYVHE